MKAVVSSNGALVPMRDASAPEWMAVSGVLPEKAKELLDKEEKDKAAAKLAGREYTPRFTLVDIPDGLETTDIEFDEPIQTPQPAIAEARDSIEIPEDWQGLKPASLVKLAKRLSDRVDSKEHAATIVQEELDRRETATDPVQGSDVASSQV